MPSLPESSNGALAYLMTRYPVNSPPALLEKVVREFLRIELNDVATEEALRKFLPAIRDHLVTEYNARYQKSGSLRYQILDDSGEQIQGIGNQGKLDQLLFQDSLNELTHSEFEDLSALVLKIAGCTDVWRTPASHDQGVDAFGYLNFLKRPHGNWLGAHPRVAFLAQAKHYSECRVGSKDVREFVGAYDLAVHKIYSTVDEKYSDLTLLPFAPAALIFMTSEEIPSTVKRLSLRSGVIVLTSDDLFELLLAHFSPPPATLTKAWILKKLRADFKNIPVAK